MNNTFNVNLAFKYGIKEAILIGHFQKLINKEVLIGIHSPNFQAERFWSRQSIDDILDTFCYFSKEEVKLLIDKLVYGKSRKGKNILFAPVLLKMKNNKDRRDQTCSYAFKNEKEFLNLNGDK